MKKVMVFGTFDGLHKSHREMLKEAKKLGDYLIVVVAQDHVVEYLKGRLPKKNLAERFEHLEKADGVDKVVIGDAEKSTWNVVRRYRPDVIAIGHEQNILKGDLETHRTSFGYTPEIVSLKHYEVSKEG